MEKQPPDKPIELIIPLTLEEVMSIDTILCTYQSFLKGNISPSRKRDEQRDVAQQLRLRLRPLISLQKLDAIDFSPLEAGTIEAALIVFGLLIPTMFPRTQDRDVVVESIKQLRQRLFGPQKAASPVLND